jgi:hypothetical protein
VIISVVYLLVRCLLGCLMMLARHRVFKASWSGSAPDQSLHGLADLARRWGRSRAHRSGPAWKQFLTAQARGMKITC